MTPSQIRTVLTNTGWKEDRFGNFLSKKGTVRVHFQKISLRVERKHVWKPIGTYTPKPQWLNITSDYFSNLSIKDGKLCIKGQVLALQSQEQ